MLQEAEPAVYSRAFEHLVQDGEDLTGLIAYALYKQSIPEAARQGRVVHRSENRSPTPTEVGAYRKAADSLLSSFADSIIDQSRPDIVDTAIRTDIARLESNLTVSIQNATTWRVAIGTNLVAWLLSIAITFLIAISGIPGWMLATARQVRSD